MSDYKDILRGFEAESRLRRIPDEGAEGRIDLLSNDYLGLAAEESVYHQEFLDRFGDVCFTSAASRLLSTRQHYHALLEESLSALYGRPALLFNSGYHANVGIIQALAIPSTLFLSDKLIHASSIDGLRLAHADFVRFPHNDVASIRRVLERKAADYGRVILLMESVYSMDGDLAPLREVVALKRDFPNLMILLDEAHGFGVRGERGLGLSEELGLTDDVDLIIGTLGKAAASAGAFVIASHDIIGYLTNTARSFIFSTALPPVNCAWSLMMIEKIISMNDRRNHLKTLSDSFAEALQEATGVATPSQSQIVPFIVGDAAGAVSLAAEISKAGYDCMAIRRPTVPAGGERLRFSLNATLDFQQLEPLIGLLKRI